jgi:alanine racemase
MNEGIYTIRDVAKITGATAQLPEPGTIIRTLATDSRRLEDVRHALFFALQGRRDGHAYIAEVYEQGVRNFVVSRPDEVSIFPDANFLVAGNPLNALQRLAAHHRRQFDIPVIAITGSNGKTIVKEWLYQLLAPEQNIIRSPKSYNSQIGVPLSVWNMNKGHTMAIFEAGISRAGEMRVLEEMIQPTIGVLTTIGEAHNEGFGSRDEKIQEKLSLFKNAGLVIYSPDHLGDYAGEIPGDRKFTWSRTGSADLALIDEEDLEEKYQFLRAAYGEEEVQCAVPFTDAASVENALCCWATLLALKYDPQTADQRLERLVPVKMRLELKTGVNNCSVIDDSYSLDISSLAIALDFLKQQNQHVRRTLILSDIPETGMDAAPLYTLVAGLLESKQVDRLIAIGEAIGAHRDLFHMETLFFNNVDELLNSPNVRFRDEAILLKGARAFRFERISKMLTQKQHETVLEINLNALEHNLNYYKSLLKPGVKMMAIVKAFSYGSGSVEIANLLQFNKVDYLAVAFADEGVTLRESGITLPVMVMNPDAGAFDAMISRRLEPELYSPEILAAFIDTLEGKGIRNYPVHLKLDTGMHRLGFMPAEMEQLTELLKASDRIEVKSVFSHLVSSEDAGEDEFTRKQLQEFEAASKKISDTLPYPFIRHMANTSAISRLKEAQFDMVRLGIGLYGLDSVYDQHTPLQPAATLRTSISQVKELKPGDTVGYNRKGLVSRDSRIATVKIGYADGYDRRLGNGKGAMLVNGKPAPTIGNICMDMLMLDVTGIEVKPGDEVIVFNGRLTVAEIAKKLETIPYEVLTGISQRVKRVYYYE